MGKAVKQVRLISPLLHAHGQHIYSRPSTAVMGLEEGHMLQGTHALRASPRQIAALCCGPHLQSILMLSSNLFQLVSFLSKQQLAKRAYVWSKYDCYGLDD